MGGLYKFSETILQQTYPNNFFNYENKLITYICKLYQARINSLLNKAEEAHMQFIELWQLAPDEESYEEAISVYLDNFIRYCLPAQSEVNLLTPSPNFLYMSQSRDNIVDQAISTSLELAEQKQHPGI